MHNYVYRKSREYYCDLEITSEKINIGYVAFQYCGQLALYVYDPFLTVGDV